MPAPNRSSVRLALWAPMLLLTALPVPAWSSDLARQTSNIFDTMLNVSQPVSHLGQRRGVFSGGSVTARNRIINENLVTWVPPSFQAGCGGIDLFAGSFSFINADQFQQLMRAVAANAAGYAFQIALQSMCPTCMDNLTDLQRKVQSLNEMFGNSCQMAQGLVNDVASAFNQKLKDDTSRASLLRGIGDVFETRSATTGRDPIEQVRDTTSHEQRVAAGLAGNLVWHALRRHNAPSMFVGGGQELAEAIMSVTGTIIVGEPAPAPDGRGPNYQLRHLPGNLVTVNDLLWGSRFLGPFQDEGRGHRVFLYRCDNQAPERCLHPTRVEVNNLRGLVQHVRHLLLGDPRVGGSIGLVQKLRHGDNTLTAPERSFLDTAPGGYGAMIRNLARYDVGAARAFVDVGAPVIAIEMVNTVLNDLLRAAQIAMASAEHAYTGQLVTQIERAQQELHRQYEVASTRYGNPQTLAQYHANLMAAVKAPQHLVGDHLR
ncbi:MAG: TraH family protein [Chromatiaceae bacterium]|nr:MAG: TraH family protein [Chromatiaceae bacterium]